MTDDSYRDDITCQPIKSLTDLADFLNHPPQWVDSISDLVPRSPEVLKYNGAGKCHYDTTETIYDKRYSRNFVPKTLVCHDFKNGYLLDRFVNGCENGVDGYVFDKWSHIDIFVYFSHHFITIPPPGWIFLAHKNQVKILGTFITEWDDGNAFWNSIIKNDLPSNIIENDIIKLANDLAKLMSMLKIDGWLINIENPISRPEYLLSFVKHLTHSAHKLRPGSLIIWYDSVKESGELKWQNELNSNNRCYFDVCDGIFLNYNWTAEGLRRSAATAQHRHLDVYAGVDVFGRGCYGNGRFHTYLAARETRKAHVSMAIFAPAWTHETMPPIEDSNRQEITVDRFLHRDNAFWRSLAPFLYTHPMQKPFFTTFNTGVNVQRFDLNKQDIVLHRIAHSKLPANEEELCVETLLSWSCACVQLYHDHTTGRAVVELMSGNGRVHRLFACNIPILINGFPLTLVTVCERLSGEDNMHASLQVLITIEDGLSGCRKQLICTDEELAPGEYNSAIKRCDRTVQEVAPCDTHYCGFVDKIKNACPNLHRNSRINAYTLDYDDGTIVDISVTIMNGSKLLLRAIGIVDKDNFKY